VLADEAVITDSANVDLARPRFPYRVNPSVTTAGKTAALDDDQQPTDLTEECRIVAEAALSP
jgi:hypothetical protein